jgi:CRP/FNR family cyclic AMP-dependent transcriptional regulator
MTIPQGKKLVSIDLLSCVSEAVRDAVMSQCRIWDYAKDEQIIDREDDNTDVYFLVSGSVRVVIYSASGREVAFDDLSPGAFFGELAALDGSPRSANVVALTSSRVAILSAAAFCRVVSETPVLALAALKHLAGIVRRSTERIMDLSTLGANNRVHGEVLRLARRVAPTGNRARIEPIPLHHDMAARVSTTRETVARVMGDLARAGIVERHPHHMIVTDIALLEEMVEHVRGER